jgi:hypothetical protein
MVGGMTPILALSQALPPLDHLPIKHSRLAAKPAKKMPQAVIRLKLLMMAIAISLGQLRVLTGACGNLKKNPDGSHWLKPTVIDQGNFTNMLSGKLPIPDWRMSQMVTICEYVAVLRMIEIEDGGPNASFYQGLLKSFPARFGWFMQRPEFRVWIERFRFAIFNRVKMDRTKSPADERIYRAYNHYLKTVDGQIDEVIESEKPGERIEERV